MDTFLIIFKIAIREDKYLNSVTGRVRLTSKGTDYFESLSNAERKDFYKKLRQELANAIPVNLERITSNENVETDSSVTPRQIFLSINIKKSEDEQEISVNLAIKDLDELIKHKSITVIGSGDSSRYLDEVYG